MAEKVMIEKENSYLLLKNQFKPLIYDNYFLLVDNKSGEKYLLDREQYQFILESTGKRTLRKIITDYSRSSKKVILNFIKKLDKVEAIEFLPEKGKTRTFNTKAIRPYLHTVTIEVTSHCNLSCLHCYLGDYLERTKGKDDLKITQIFQLIDDLVRMNVSEVNITGGEPLLRKDLKKIISYLISNNLKLGGIFTNGLLLKETFIKYLSKFPVRVYISLDGITPESYSVIRKTAGRKASQFLKVLKAIKMCVKYNIPVSVNTSVHKYNLVELKEMYTLLKRMKVDQWRLAIPRPIGRYFKNFEYLNPDFREVLKTYHDLIDRHLSETKLTKDGDIKAPINLEIEFLFNTRMINSPLIFSDSNSLICYYDRNRCVVRANGDVVPCALLDVVAGNIKQENIEKIWLSNKLQQIKNTKVGEISRCQKCRYLKYCGAGCRANAVRVSNNFYAKDNYLCPLMSFFENSLFPLFKKHNLVLKTSNILEEFLRN